MERVRRVELPTLCLASIRSSQLSYTRIQKFLHDKISVVNLTGGVNAPIVRDASESIEYGS